MTIGKRKTLDSYNSVAAGVLGFMPFAPIKTIIPIISVVPKFTVQTIGADDDPTKLSPAISVFIVPSSYMAVKLRCKICP